MRVFLFRTVLLALTFAVSATGVSGASAPVVFGIFPYVSPAKLVQFHRPLKEWLERILGRPVSLVSAPDFDTFVKRTAARRYDYILTAPHLGRLAQRRSGYQPIARTLHVVQGIYLARADSDIHSLADLKDKTITMAARVSIIFQMAEHQLKQHGLRDGIDITIRETSTHNNAMYAPLRGESDASVTGILLWSKLGQGHKAQLRVIGRTPEAPGFFFMANPGIPKGDVNRVREAVMQFHDTEAGATYFRTTGLKGFAPITNDMLQALDPYIQFFVHKQ